MTIRPAALLALALLAMPAFAQSTPANVAAAQASLEGRKASQAAALVGRIEVDQLEVDKVANFTFETPADVAVRISAACDRQCNDIDLDVSDSAHKPLGKDEHPDSFPSVVLPAGHPATVIVSVSMKTCYTDNCGVAVGVYRKKE